MSASPFLLDGELDYDFGEANIADRPIGAEAADAALRIYVRDGVMVREYDALHEYLEGRDLVTEFIRALRDRNVDFARIFHATSTEALRDPRDRRRRAEMLIDDLDGFDTNAARHTDAMARIIRIVNELLFNGFEDLSGRLRRDLETAQADHIRHPAPLGNLERNSR